MKLDKQDKIHYINNYFHQYYNINLNKNIVTTDFVNLIMPLESLSDREECSNLYHFSHTRAFSKDDDVDGILEKYEDTTFTDLIDVFCLRVIDGDTLQVAIPYESPYDNNTIEINEEKIRLVGINTPEENYDGYESSKLFLEKLVYEKSFFDKVLDTDKYEWEVKDKKITGRLSDKTKTNKYFKNTKRIQIKVDSRRQRDQYNRVLAVLVVDNKNINEIILKEGFGEIMYIPPSEFNPFDWSDFNTPVNIYKFDNTSINFLSQFFNSDYSNIVFTPQNNFNHIYPSQVYKDVIYVKLLPFSQNITMHLFPKIYNCSDNILFLRDDMISKRTFTQSSKNNYKFYEDRGNINAYYQVNGKDRDRTQPEYYNKEYNVEDWEDEWCEFNYDISEDSAGFSNIEICAGYSYNNTSPYHALHYLGVKDNSLRPPEDRAFLVDVNTDNVLTKKNIITQMIPNDNKTINNLEDDIISVPPHNNIKIYNAYPDDIDHISIIHKTHHKKIKYIHDMLYSEEDIYDISCPKEGTGETSTKNKKQYTVAEWVDISKDGYTSHYTE